MSSGYRALLQSLDETESDITRGLGRSIKIKRKPSRCCCSGRKNCCMWTCMTLAILAGLVLSVGVPILLTMPVESLTHWRRWLPQSWTHHHNITNSTIINGTNPLQGSDGLQVEDGQQGTTNWTMPVLGHNGSHHHHGPKEVHQPEVSSNITVLQETIHQVHKMTEWMKEQYVKMPKVPLIVALCVSILAMLTVLWFVIYRRIKRRQRRRAIGKMVTDLQSGKTLLNSDDSEED